MSNVKKRYQKKQFTAMIAAERDNQVPRRCKSKQHSRDKLERMLRREAARVIQWVRDYYPDWSHGDLDNNLTYKPELRTWAHAEFDRRNETNGFPKIWKASVRRRMRNN